MMERTNGREAYIHPLSSLHGLRPTRGRSALRTTSAVDSEQQMNEETCPARASNNLTQNTRHTYGDHEVAALHESSEMRRVCMQVAQSRVVTIT